MNRALRRAARKAKRVSRSNEPIDWQAVQTHEDALREMERPMLCPCCSFLWDQADAEAAMQAGPENYAAWLYRTLALAVNETGETLGARGEPVTLADFDAES